MELTELIERLKSLEHDRPGVMAIKHKDDGTTLARCTAGVLVELMIRILDAPDESLEQSHWLWQHLRNAAPHPEAGAVYEGLRRHAQGLSGETIQEAAGAYLAQSELVAERRRGRSV